MSYFSPFSNKSILPVPSGKIHPLFTSDPTSLYRPVHWVDLRKDPLLWVVRVYDTLPLFELHNFWSSLRHRPHLTLLFLSLLRSDLSVSLPSITSLYPSVNSRFYFRQYTRLNIILYETGDISSIPTFVFLIHPPIMLSVYTLLPPIPTLLSPPLPLLTDLNLI